MNRYTLRLFVALLTFAVGVSLVAFWYSRAYISRVHDERQERAEAEASAWRTLLPFEDQDLTKLDEKSKSELRKAINTLLGKRTDFESEYLVPSLFLKMSTSQGERRYVFIETLPLVVIPGSSELHIHEFNLAGQLLHATDFSVGYRRVLTGLKVMYRPEIGREIIAVSSRPVFRRDKQFEETQYYALIGEDVLLVRIEDGNGQITEITRNEYDPTHFTIGHTIIGRSAQEWEQALKSEDTAEVLATLTWLGGRHRGLVSPQLSPYDEEMSECCVVNEVRSRVDVQETLKRLMRAKNIWIREAAKAVVKFEDH